MLSPQKHRLDAFPVLGMSPFLRTGEIGKGPSQQSLQYTILPLTGVSQEGEVVVRRVSGVCSQILQMHQCSLLPVFQYRTSIWAMFSQVCTYHTTFWSKAFPFRSFKFIFFEAPTGTFKCNISRFREQVEMNPSHAFRKPVISIQVQSDALGAWLTGYLVVPIWAKDAYLAKITTELEH